MHVTFSNHSMSSHVTKSVKSCTLLKLPLPWPSLVERIPKQHSSSHSSPSPRRIGWDACHSTQSIGFNSLCVMLTLKTHRMPDLHSHGDFHLDFYHREYRCPGAITESLYWGQHEVYSLYISRACSSRMGKM